MSNVKYPRSFFPCYVCERLYTLHSLKFHTPRCLARWRAENEKKPLYERETTPVDYTEWPTTEEGQQEFTSWQNQYESEEDDRPPELRPGTRTLLNPTPNIVHPVISPLKKEKKQPATIQEQPKSKLNNQLLLRARNNAEENETINKRLGNRTKVSSSCCGLTIPNGLSSKLSPRNKIRSSRRELPRSRPTRIERKPARDSFPMTDDLLTQQRSGRLPIRVYKPAPRLTDRNNNNRAFDRKMTIGETSREVSDKGGTQRGTEYQTCKMCGKQVELTRFKAHETNCLKVSYLPLIVKFNEKMDSNLKLD
ncbi:uncharacterized protein LOC118203227 [Stegodyphus dumicola]|uniref:uncharacterized protein LOC118203227 n=1 Tax=Stegodyphus dumicola TaxID=202533 RepID=UPI0015AE0311|nr:uncharacterized protein LOC118203227 [Stegodyphus dumicola]